MFLGELRKLVNRVFYRLQKKMPNCTENLLSFDFLLLVYETKVLLGLSVYIL